MVMVEVLEFLTNHVLKEHHQVNIITRLSEQKWGRDQGQGQEQGWGRLQGIYNILLFKCLFYYEI